MILMPVEQIIPTSVLSICHFKHQVPVPKLTLNISLLPVAEHVKHVRLCLSLPVRLLRRQPEALHLRARDGDEIPEAHLGPAA